MEKASNKSERLSQLEQLLLANPQGLHRADIARRLHVNKSTITRYVDELSRGDVPIPIYEEDDGRIKINRERYLNYIALTLNEVTALHISTRLMAAVMDKHNPYAASALRKLGQALETFSPTISKHMQTSANVMDDTSQRYDPNYLRVLEILTKAWSEGRRVHIWHKSRKWDRVFEYDFEPYFIEPNAVGHSVYVIGNRPNKNMLRTYKVARIERAELLDETYTIPTNFDPTDKLADAWGIWYTDKEPVEVVLRFHPRVADRVEETRWHRNEQTTRQSDGYLLWRTHVAEPKEMLNWVRGWGADCEVLEPAWLRRALERVAHRLVALYGVINKTDDDLIAHRRKKDGEEQPLITHLTEASKLAEQFASKIGLPEVGKIMGLLHDFGKASKEYQDYLRSAEGLINPDDDDYVDYKAKKGKIDHSTAGAQLVYQKLAEREREGQFTGQFLALAIASHHSGLVDCLSPKGNNYFQQRIDKPDDKTHLSEARQKLPMIEQQLDEILAEPIEQQFFAKVFQEMNESDDSKETLWFRRGLLARFLLSCLLEADRLNTADFEHPENEAVRNYGKYIAWETLIERLEAKFVAFARETATMKPGRALEVNQLRAEVAQACLEAAKKPKGIYQLTVPTGGGKTLASLRFALHHAREHKMDRIFYVVPYITIIDQNAKDVRKVLKDVDENGHPLGKIVLEHHSNFVPPDDTRHRHNLLAENWDAPIVFTTQVQFLEALFSAGTRDARRMHQLANSVIIFDEVQTIPIKITHMFTTALRFLTHDCGATVVLCTATPPPLDKLPNEYRKLTIKPEHKIIKNEEELFKKLKRVEVYDKRKPGGMTNTEIAELAEHALQEKGSVLIVVNTRRMAQTLYKEIKGRKLATTYHLSTNMCPAHRLEKLEEIKAKLEAKEPVICVSTQLVEAGVDVDFGAVIRSLAGLDSIAQAAGRCNRHGERDELGSVWVVNPQDENLSKLPDISIGREKAQTVLDNFKVDSIPYGNDRIGLSAIAEYYRYYYIIRANEMDYPVSGTPEIGRDGKLYDLLSRNAQSVEAYRRINRATPNIPLRQSFQSAGRAFHVINSVTRGVVVPYGEGKAVIADLCSAPELEKQYKLLKKAQRYSVNLYDHQFEKLSKIGAIQEVQQGTGIYYLDERYYDAEFGWSNEQVSRMSVPIA